MNYLRVEQMAAESGIHSQTILKALRTGKLHGGQAVKRGTWRVEEGCFRAWVRGDACSHRVEQAA